MSRTMVHKYSGKHLWLNRRKQSNDFSAPRILSHVAGCESETHIRRQAILHDCLPSLVGDRDKGIEMVYSEEKILYWHN